MKRFGLPALAVLLLVPAAAASQHTQQTEPVEGLRDNTPGVHALTGARVVTAPGQELDDATVVIRNGVIQEVGQGVSPPEDARVWDLEGHTIYPGFIDAHARLGLDDAPENGEAGHWNPQARAHFDAANGLDDGEEARHGLRSQGFTTANAVPRLGIFRGQTAVVSLNDASARQRVVEAGVAQSVSFSRSTALGATYPNSSMGAIAFMRQTLHDADWHERAWDTYRQNPQGLDQPERSVALEALNPAIHGEQPLLFESRREEEYLRAAALAEEFPATQHWVRGSGDEYRILDVVQDSDVPLILPLDFPDAPDVDTPEDALGVSLSALRHWYLAPENPGRLADAGVEFALTADGLDNGEDFLAHLREAVDRGLDRTTALEALTTTPAGLLGIQDRHGTLEAGNVANAVVVDGDLFDDDAEVRDVWVRGERYVISTPDRLDPRGEWLVASVDDGRLEGSLTLEGSPGRLNGTIEVNGEEVSLRSASVRPEAGRLRVSFSGDALGLDGLVRLSASLDGDEAFGWSEFPGGTGPSWRAERVAAAADADGEGGNAGASREAPRPALDLPDIRPNLAYGREGLPEQPEHVLVTNATVWTQGPEGRIEGADLLVSNGQVEAVGQNLDAPSGAEVIDATGKHVTPGLIDAHLHSGTHGVNETGDAIVPEVRLGDVVTHNTSWTYRQVAGGLTTAHVKHGSANPIGGENVFVKMRWGGLPHELKLDAEHRTIKFALGENPKRRGGRYPDTRMGTHQIIRDNFKAALDYRERWEEWEATGEGIPPRRDFRMEAIVGILDEDIGIQSHGYRQDEFLMLVRLAEEFDFSVQAIQHGVEAYKIAPELAESGVGAVVWSDWSSFKIEAYDATVYNARILNEAGVLTSLHSDNSHIASRMNWEAGKMVRAGMDEEDALALVTNNTAEVLGIDDRVGSLEPGKDADFVIWNGHPLSQFTRAEQTWIDGARYFDLEEHRQRTEEVERERSALIQLLLDD